MDDVTCSWFVDFAWTPPQRSGFNTKPGDLESSEFHQFFVWLVAYSVECSSPVIGTSQCNIIQSKVGCVCLRLYNCSKAREYTRFNLHLGPNGKNMKMKSGTNIPPQLWLKKIPHPICKPHSKINLESTNKASYERMFWTSSFLDMDPNVQGPP